MLLKVLWHRCLLAAYRAAHIKTLSRTSWRANWIKASKKTILRSEIPMTQDCTWQILLASPKFFWNRDVCGHSVGSFIPTRVEAFSDKSPRCSCHHVTLSQSLLTYQFLQKGAVFHWGVSTIYSRKLSSLSPHPAAQTADQCILILKSKPAALNTVFGLSISLAFLKSLDLFSHIIFISWRVFQYIHLLIQKKWLKKVLVQPCSGGACL